ncbi:hypothetical protein PR048_012316 [Dryococelus australis]|uniref:Uncharacterized protein n=1 Tax=Dryococelus australis TaxID=614101 RepID=A0ABQ9HP57_9NEOP|nr:hypothetical protein PR048_012316 [Dryococelus australis]
MYSGIPWILNMSLSSQTAADDVDGSILTSGHFDTLDSHQGNPDSIPGGVIPCRCSHMKNVDFAIGGFVFSGYFCFPCLCILLLLHLRVTFQGGSWGRDDVMGRLLASHLGKLGLIPSGVAAGFSHVGIVPDNASVLCSLDLNPLTFGGISRPLFMQLQFQTQQCFASEWYKVASRYVVFLEYFKMSDYRRHSVFRCAFRHKGGENAPVLVLYGCGAPWCHGPVVHILLGQLGACTALVVLELAQLLGMLFPPVDGGWLPITHGARALPHVASQPDHLRWDVPKNVHGSSVRRLFSKYNSLRENCWSKTPGGRDAIRLWERSRCGPVTKVWVPQYLDVLQVEVLQRAERPARCPLCIMIFPTFPWLLAVDEGSDALTPMKLYVLITNLPRCADYVHCRHVCPAWPSQANCYLVAAGEGERSIAHPFSAGPGC